MTRPVVFQQMIQDSILRIENITEKTGPDATSNLFKYALKLKEDFANPAVDLNQIRKRLNNVWDGIEDLESDLSPRSKSIGCKRKR